MTRTFHVQIDMRNAIDHWEPHEWHHVLTADGISLSADEARGAFLSLLSTGCRYLPVGGPCEGWTPEGGCPGHTNEGGTDGC